MSRVFPSPKKPGVQIPSPPPAVGSCFDADGVEDNPGLINKTRSRWLRRGWSDQARKERTERAASTAMICGTGALSNRQYAWPRSLHSQPSMHIEAYGPMPARSKVLGRGGGASGRRCCEMMRAAENVNGLVRGAFCEFSLVRGSTGSAFTRQMSQVRSL